MMRYPQNRGYAAPSRFSRFRPILVIILVLVAAFLIFKMAGIGGINEGNFEAQRNSALRSEVQMAVSSVSSLSRLGASTSSGMLGRVRQYVHGAEIINELNVGMYGEAGRIYSQSVFENIYSIIEEYELRLSSGQKVSDTLTSLTEAVIHLQETTYAVLEKTEAQ